MADSFGLDGQCSDLVSSVRGSLSLLGQTTALLRQQPEVQEPQDRGHFSARTLTSSTLRADFSKIKRLTPVFFKER